MKGIRKRAKRLLIFVCIFCLCSGMNVQANQEPPGDLPFYEDGDVIGFIGDSITHVQYGPVNYLEALYHYYLSRFPERKIEFRNLSAAEYKASDVLNIFDRDPAFRGINKAVIMLGMNEAILEIPTEDYIRGVEEIVNRLEADGLDGEDILVLAPTPYDEKCALNYDRSGNPYWLIDHSLVDYMNQLAEKTVEWGVQYLDLHTPMLELSEQIQKENPRNTLTRGDCIHPSTTGQMLMAYYILQAQGAADLESGIFVSGEGEAQAVRGELTDFYRGEKGMCWLLKPETLPAAMTEDFLEYLEFFDPGRALYQEPLRIEGLSEDISYHVYMGEAELGAFTGKELGEGVNLALLETHPLQETAQQLEVVNRELHQKVMEYRAMWIDVMMKTAEYTEEQVREKYEGWRAEDAELREEMYAIAQGAVGDAFRMTVVEEGCSIEELEQEKKKAEEEAKRAAAEQIMKETQEKIHRAAKVRDQAEAEKEAGKVPWLIIVGVFVVTVVVGAGVHLSRKQQKKKPHKRRRRKSRRKH